MWSSIELVLSKVSFLHSWPFLYHPLHICFLSSPTVMYSSCQIPLSASFISFFSSTSLRRDEPFPAFPVFSIHWLLIPLLQFLSILSSCVYNFLFSILLRPSSTPSPPTCTLYILNIHLLLLISTFPMLPLTTPLPSSSSSPSPLPLPTALVDWAWDLCHDLCGSGARLRAHGDHKQLPHSDKVMDHKNQKCMAPARSINVFIYSKGASHWHWDGLQCSNNTEAGRESKWAPCPWELKLETWVIAKLILIIIFLLPFINFKCALIFIWKFQSMSYSP